MIRWLCSSSWEHNCCRMLAMLAEQTNHQSGHASADCAVLVEMAELLLLPRCGT